MAKLRFIMIFSIIMCLTSCVVFADSPTDYFEDDYFEDDSYYETTFSQFIDVLEGDFCYDAVNWAVEEGITSGTSDTTFSPFETCTRGQVVTFLWRALGSPESEMSDNIFTDVSDDAYYYEAVLWAYENYITSGTTATTFSPDETCTSGQVITFLWRALGEPDADISILPVSEQSQYYAQAVAWAMESNLLNYSTRKFAAENLSPRADIVTYLYYALN